MMEENNLSAYTEEELLEQDLFETDDDDYVDQAQPLAPVHNDGHDEFTPVHPLETLNGIEVSEFRFKREKFIVEGLLKPGLAVLAGSPKIGKSWLVLHLCSQVSKGEPFFGMPTQESDVLYLALEDSKQRLQRRLLTIDDEPSVRMHFALSSSKLNDELDLQLAQFLIKYPLTRLVVIDTFQMVRGSVGQMSYANDYADVSALKRLADDMHVCILLVHHTRKMSDSDRFNEISGTNGIAGSADTLMVLTKEKRADRKAMLSCTGRDIDDLELELVMDRRTCKWECKTPLDSRPGMQTLPDILLRLVDFMKQQKYFRNNNKSFCEMFSSHAGVEIDPKSLNQKISYYRYELEDRGVTFTFLRSSNERGLEIFYDPMTDRFNNDDL